MKVRLLGLLLMAVFFGHSQNQKVEIAEVIKELQVTKKSGDNMKVAIWLPTEYWAISLQDNPDVTPEVIEKIKSIFEDFILIIAVDVDIVGAEFKPNPAVKAELIDSNNIKHKLLKESELPGETRDMLNVLKPALANMLGNFGKNMQLLMFDATDKNGDKIAEASGEGALTLLYNGERFEWDLPFSFLMSPKKCPVDDAPMNAKWRYCPYHGNELVE